MPAKGDIKEEWAVLRERGAVPRDRAPLHRQPQREDGEIIKLWAQLHREVSGVRPPPTGHLDKLTTDNGVRNRPTDNGDNNKPTGNGPGDNRLLIRQNQVRCLISNSSRLFS